MVATTNLGAAGQRTHLYCWELNRNISGVQSLCRLSFLGSPPPPLTVGHLQVVYGWLSTELRQSVCCLLCLADTPSGYSDRVLYSVLV